MTSTQVQTGKVDNYIDLRIYRGINTIDPSLIDKVTRSSPSRFFARNRNYLQLMYIQHFMDLQLAVDPYKRCVLFESTYWLLKTHKVSWHISANQISTKHSPTAVVWYDMRSDDCNFHRKIRHLVEELITFFVYFWTSEILIETCYPENNSFRDRDLKRVTQCWMPSKFSDAELYTTYEFLSNIMFLTWIILFNNVFSSTFINRSINVLLEFWGVRVASTVFTMFASRAFHNVIWLQHSNAPSFNIVMCWNFTSIGCDCDSCM